MSREAIKSSPAESTPILHGYDAVFDPELDQRNKCPVCLVALRDPVQTKCGHRFCRTCLEHSRGKSKYGKCPIDNTWFDPKRHVFDDNAAKREILSLTVKCDNHLEGCDWRSELREREDHLLSCPCGSTQCTNDCGHECKRKELMGHLKECPKRLEACQHCTEDIPVSELTKHQLLVCQKFPVACSVCGETGILRESIPRHMDSLEGDCPLVIIKCQFEHLGCYFQDKRKHMLSHYSSANLHHMQLITMKIQRQEDALNRQRTQMLDVVEKCEQLSLLTDDLKKTINEQREVIQVQSSCIEELEKLGPDGCLLWRLALVSDAGIGKVTSPSFLTGSPGYKVKFVLDVTPNPSEEDQFSTMQLHVEEGPYDEMLEFPFKGTCQVTIFDQSDGGSNMKFGFRCNADTVCGPTAQSEVVKIMKRDQICSWPYMKNNALLILVNVCQIQSLN